MLLFCLSQIASIAQSDSATVKKLRFFLEYYYREKALEKDTVILHAKITEYKKQVNLLLSTIKNDSIIIKNDSLIKLEMGQQTDLIKWSLEKCDKDYVKSDKKQKFYSKLAYIFGGIAILATTILIIKR